MNIFSYVMGGFIAVIPLIAGLVLKFFPPKEINPYYGFRTETVAKNQETWNYGHRICGKLLIIYSIFSVILFVLPLVLARSFFDGNPVLRIVLGAVLTVTALIAAVIRAQIKTAEFGKDLERTHKYFSKI
jgi:uncharacterized membrane protein